MSDKNSLRFGERDMTRQWFAPVLAAACLASPSWAAEAYREAAGRLADGTPVEAITLSNASGVSARILTYGATLQSLVAPDRDGAPADITIGYDDLASYEEKPNYFGVTVGRYANRIAGAAFELDGKRHTLSRNDGANSLHGGAQGFDKRNWKVEAVEDGPVAKLVLSLTSPDGDQGYPGKLDVKVTYMLDDRGDLGIVFEAATDAPTVVNLADLALSNMPGTIEDQEAMRHWLSSHYSDY